MAVPYGDLNQTELIPGHDEMESGLVSARPIRMRPTGFKWRCSVPVLAFPVAVDVGMCHVLAVPGQDLRSMGALPARVSRTAVISPVTPAPAMMTSADRGPFSSWLAAQGCSARSANHKEVMAGLVPGKGTRKRGRRLR
jgi:hypothetical protein